MRVLVTGGAGFIGSHFVDSLLASGHSVVVVDDLSSGTLANLPVERITLVRKDARNATALDFVEPIEAIVHLAARPSVHESWEQPLCAHEANLSLTLHVLRLAAKLGVRRIVFASSAAVYGGLAKVPIDELASTIPDSPYGLQKLASEHYGRLFAKADGMNFIALRFFNVFGPRQVASSPYSGVISKFLAAMEKGEPVRITGDGLQTRDFVYVKDAAVAILSAVTRPLSNAPWSVFNIGTGRPTSVLELRQQLLSLFPNADHPPKVLPAPPGDIRTSTACVASATEDLGFAARYSLNEGLAEFVNS